jgi:DNA helicase-2/ATP-dependent DNA helicase PcrA
VTKKFSIETLWDEVNFKPNQAQEKAIKHVEGALYLTAGPGSGKTRVLLWRTLNHIYRKSCTSAQGGITSSFRDGK